MKYAITCLFLITLLAPAAYADDHIISKQEAIELAQQRHPGRVLSVKLNKEHYHIKMIDDKGNVRLVKIAAGKETPQQD